MEGTSGVPENGSGATLDISVGWSTLIGYRKLDMKLVYSAYFPAVLFTGEKGNGR